MPNYCSNSLYVRGTKENVLKFVNKGLGALGVHADNLNEAKELIDLYGLYSKDNPLMKEHDRSRSSHKDTDPIDSFSLECYLPMPATYHEWDTTNSFCSEHPIHSKEYKAEKKGYEAAKKLQQEMYGAVGWFRWRVQNYGTKWNAGIEFGDMLEKDNEVELILYIETAWNPCYEWLETVQEENKYVRFHMVSGEPGMVFRYEYESDGYYDGDVDSFCDDDEVCIWVEDHSDEFAKELEDELGED